MLCQYKTLNNKKYFINLQELNQKVAYLRKMNEIFLLTFE